MDKTDFRTRIKTDSDIRNQRKPVLCLSKYQRCLHPRYQRANPKLNDIGLNTYIDKGILLIDLSSQFMKIGLPFLCLANAKADYKQNSNFNVELTSIDFIEGQTAVF